MTISTLNICTWSMYISFFLLILFLCRFFVPHILHSVIWMLRRNSQQQSIAKTATVYNNQMIWWKCQRLCTSFKFNQIFQINIEHTKKNIVFSKIRRAKLSWYSGEYLSRSHLFVESLLKSCFKYYFEAHTKKNKHTHLMSYNSFQIENECLKWYLPLLFAISDILE